MKKALLLMAAFVGILAFSSCEKEEITKPANNNGNSTESFRFVSFEALNEITDYWGVYSATYEAVKLAFEKNGIEIPFPQMTVHLDK